jgi:hypothetical protein
MTLKVATHLRVTITEQQYFEPVSQAVEIAAAQAKAVAARKAAGKENQPEKLPEDEAVDALRQGLPPGLPNCPALRPLTDIDDTPIRTYDFTTQLIETDTIALVDQKRPAAGTIAYRSAISEDYSLREMQGSVEDVSIRQIGFGIASTIAALTGTRPPANPAAVKPNPKSALKNLDPGGNHTRPAEVTSGLAPGPDGFLIQTRVIATRIFDLNDPDLELQITEFLTRSLSEGRR